MVLDLVHLDLEFGPKIELIFILRGAQNEHECLFRI